MNKLTHPSQTLLDKPDGFRIEIEQAVLLIDPWKECVVGPNPIMSVAPINSVSSSEDTKRL